MLPDKYLIKHFSHRDTVDPIPTNSRYIGNDRCQANALSYARKHPTKVNCIVGCLQVFDDSTDHSAVAHFVVKLNDGTYIDPTYGNMTDLYWYLIPIEEYQISKFNPNRELTNLKRHLHNLLPWWLRLITTPDNR